MVKGCRLIMKYNGTMKSLIVRLPEALVAEIEAESRRRGLSKSDVVRERLTKAAKSRQRQPASFDAIADLVGSIDRLPRDLSARTKKAPEIDQFSRQAHSLSVTPAHNNAAAAGTPPACRAAKAG
jgi:Arc/MetJ-type ribon-helix-helix transcriptional regulator